eukprot:4247581-Pleurochrysis_carterae.AAC.1
MSYLRLQHITKVKQWQLKRRAPLTRPTSSRCRPQLEGRKKWRPQPNQGQGAGGPQPEGRHRAAGARGPTLPLQGAPGQERGLPRALD